MPTYTAHFYTEADWATTTIAADTPELALQRARQIESEETETLDFQSYHTTNGVELIEIWAADRHTVAEWLSSDRLRRLAARDLHTALEAQTDAAQAVIDAWERGRSGGCGSCARCFDPTGTRGPCQGETAGQLIWVSPAGICRRGLLPPPVALRPSKSGLEISFCSCSS
jgi:hypothetical protein